jgi:hypothetical protein
MSDDRQHDVGLTRRELEREMHWLIRRLPDDPAAFARLMAEAVVTLIAKNNAALARCIDREDDGKPGAP